MLGLGQAQRALLGTIADGLAAIDDSKAELQSRAELPPLGSDPVSLASSANVLVNGNVVLVFTVMYALTLLEWPVKSTAVTVSTAGVLH